MITLCKISVNTTLTIDELKGLEKILKPWSDGQFDSTGCMYSIDLGTMADLRAGELPRPSFLLVSESIHSNNEDGELDPLLEPNYMAALKKLLDDGKRRIVTIGIDHSPACGCEPFRCGYREALRDLEATLLDDDLIEDIKIIRIPLPEEL